MMSKLDVKDVSRYPNILQPQVTAGKSYVQVWGHRVASILGDCVMSDPSEAQSPCSVPPRLQVSNPLRAIQGRNSFQTLILSSTSSVLDAFGHPACYPVYPKLRAAFSHVSYIYLHCFRMYQPILDICNLSSIDRSLYS
jgi:hypothetical protein